MSNNINREHKLSIHSKYSPYSVGISTFLAAHWFTTGLTSAMHYTDHTFSCKRCLKNKRKKLYFLTNNKKGSLSFPFLVMRFIAKSLAIKRRF